MFEIYDLNGDGFIAREEMYTLLKPCLAKMSLSSDDDPEEGVKDLVEMVLKKLVSLMKIDFVNVKFYYTLVSPSEITLKTF